MEKKTKSDYEMKYFTMREMTRSAKGESRGIDNTPGGEETENIVNLVEKVLDPLRGMYGKPIYVNSGFRNKEVNKLVGGVGSSQHLKGEAVDITAGSRLENMVLFDLIKKNLEYDQLIDERNLSWIHVSLKRDESKNRNQILFL